MSCSTVYYKTNVFGHVLGKETLNAVGIISEKPKLGRGVGSVHAYHTHFSDKEYAGMCYMTFDIFEKFVEYLMDNDLIIDANVLYMSDPKDNIYEFRYYHLFLKKESDIFVFKTFLSNVPDELKTNGSKKIIEPYLYWFKNQRIAYHDKNFGDIIYRINIFFLRESEPDEMHNDGYFLPEIEEWCKETFGRIPRVYYHEPYGKKYQQFGSGWFVYFISDAEAIAFKMKWNDWKDLQKL